MDFWDILFARQHGYAPSGDYWDTLLGRQLGDGGIWETENAPYLFRPSAGYLNSRLLNKEKDCLVGASVGWSQLVKSGDVSVSVPSGHKYYANINNSKTIGSSNGTAISINDSTKDNVIDLTLMLGSTIADYAYTLESGTAGAGIAWLKSYGFFDKPYYAYDNGSLQSVNATKHITTGRNQLKGTEYGGAFYNKSAGASLANTTTYASYQQNGNEVDVTATDSWQGVIFATDLLPIGTYNVHFSVASSSIRASIYTTDKDLVVKANELNVTAAGDWNKSITLAEPSRIAVYLGMSLASTIKITDLQVEGGSTFTSYQPYEAHEYTLADLDLRGLFKMDADHNLYADGDTYESSGVVTRKYASVDLGTLSWSNPSPNIFNVQISEMNTATAYKVICSKYPYGTNAFAWASVDTYADKTIHTSNNAYIYIKDAAYSDAAAFKTAMNGVYLIYELATPTTETATPFASPQNVDKAGTEEYVTNQKFVPIGHETEYKCSPLP